MPDLSRRSFLFLTGGSGAAAALEPGRQLVNRLIPWVNQPETVRPGEWTIFATTCRECPAGCGMHLWHRDGRVTKAEGNPAHPVNRGGLCPRGQSSVQGLYDPDRVTRPLYRRRGETAGAGSWGDALEALAGRLKKGRGRVALVSDLQTGALAEVMASFARTFAAEDRLLFFEAFNYQPLRTAHRLLFGTGAIPDYRLEECDYLISFGADFLETWVSPVGYASRFARMHAYRQGHNPGKFAYVGPRLSMTAANADDFVQVPPARERWVALAMLEEMVRQGWHRGPAEPLHRLAASLGGKEAGPRSGLSPDRIRRLAAEFARARRSVAVAGPVAGGGPAAVDACLAAALLNAAAGRMGQTVDFQRPHALGRTATDEGLRRLVGGLTAEDLLIIHRTNIAFTRPHLIKELQQAGTIVYLADLADETAELADWVLPLDNPLEAWGDYEPVAGLHALMQPTMGRLYESRSGGDFLIALADAAGRPLSRPGGETAPSDFFEWLQLRWRDLGQGGEERDFSEFWRRSLQRGGYWAEPAATKVELRPAPDLAFSPPVDLPEEAERAELWLWPSIYFFDGRLANRGWLQEMPHPVSTICWGSWADLHPRQAADLQLKEGDILEIATTEGSIEAAVRITEEVSERTLALVLGQGHSATALSVAQGVGDNPFRLLGETAAGVFPRVALRPTGRRNLPVYVSATREQHARHLLQTVTLPELEKMRESEGESLILPTPEGYDPGRDIYAPHEHRTHRWAMAIDLHQCIGCHACAVACYAENNIPVLGRSHIERGREMAWLRVPPYRLEHHPDKIAWLPLPCQHCDAAPCEPVCPVFAAVHNEEGLNAQIYNRCIGTRYCSNNCPYKVRRFNWFNIAWKKPLDLQLNPEVTVRSRGVMEKCTFCVQRIRQAEYQARIEDRPVRDGEIQPACVQSCPTRVFVFGDLKDPESEISRFFRKDPRRYQVLRELNTKPAVAYLKKIVLDT